MMRYALILVAMAWGVAHGLLGAALIPGPLGVGRCLCKLVVTPGFWGHWGISLFRGGTALGVTLILALVAGMAAGRNRRIMGLTLPLAAILQATPPILWITLVMVWMGSGEGVPFWVVTAALFPPLFLSISRATAALDPRFFDMARIYGVGWLARIKDLIFPGIFVHFLAGVSHGLGSCLKITAMAEFLSGGRGMGAQMYWAYRMMDMELLFAWSLVLVGSGVVLELYGIRPLDAWVRRAGNAGT